MQTSLFLLICLCTLLRSTRAATKGYCTLPGLLLPKPTRLASSSPVAKAGLKLDGLFDNIANGSILVGFDARNISFTIGMVSLSDPLPLWEYHHLAPANIDGTKTPDGDSEWMIGSISKVFTDLILLRLGLDVNDPVHKYLPQLKGGDSETDWDSITLASLANHMSGIRMNYGYPEIYDLVPSFEALGFPPLEPSDFPTCGIAGLNKACDPNQLIEALKNSHPVVSPHDRPIYSSISFTLLSYALQAATGRNYTQLLQDEVLNPLNLTHTGAQPGNTTNAVIPATQPNSWGVDYGDNAPGGGLHSSLNDLARLAHSILARITLPNPADVRKWLQPTGFTGPANNLVGAPWEIFRSQALTGQHNVDIHAKDGGALAYVARMALLDSYGVAFVAFTAGGKGNEALDPVFEAALATFGPAVERAARDEAAQLYVGTYSRGGNVTGSLVLGMDDGPGLKVRDVRRDGVDMLGAIRAVWDLQPVSPGVLDTDFRLYPMGVSRKVSRLWDGKEVGVIEEDWRMLIAPDASWNYTSSLPKAGTGIWESRCAAWQSVDTLYYGGEPIDRFVVVKDMKRGVVVGIESPALRLTLEKKN